MLTWFGPSWGSPLNNEFPGVPAPLGHHCGHCHEVIGPDESGIIMQSVGVSSHVLTIPYHLECHLRLVIGGINHQLGLCHCFGGREPSDPPGMPPRIAARIAVANYYNRKLAALN